MAGEPPVVPEGLVGGLGGKQDPFGGGRLPRIPAHYTWSETSAREDAGGEPEDQEEESSEYEEEIQAVDDQPEAEGPEEESSECEEEIQAVDDQTEEEEPARRSRRTCRPPQWMRDYVMEC